ncbi:hypothetical protein KFE25_002728 [Diacronema lutheri]|uniref:Fcf2 pre-rRNA processing C-terminal domain-containing protein n=1 Tax=Diacronema lutheri TaxID=2081491 RepID=A0A8J5XI52_DIALT|nr:hypothetical protein KFE25_002728 [Diacronema lutheri]
MAPPRKDRLEPLIGFGVDGIATLSAQATAAPKRVAKVGSVAGNSHALNAFDSRMIPVIAKRTPAAPSSAWHEIGKAEMTRELKDDLNVVAMLGVIDPKRFYKRSDYKKGKLPTNVHVGTIVEGPTEFRSARLARSERRTNMVAELMADSKVRSYAKRKFLEVQTQSQRGGRNASKAKAKARKPKWAANRH